MGHLPIETAEQTFFGRTRFVAGDCLRVGYLITDVNGKHVRSTIIGKMLSRNFLPVMTRPWVSLRLLSPDPPAVALVIVVHLRQDPSQRARVQRSSDTFKEWRFSLAIAIGKDS